MKKILALSKKLGKQPLKWCFAVSSSPYNHNMWWVKLLSPIIKLLYKKKHHPSLLVDDAIIGSNPILTAILLYKISQDSLLRSESKKIALLFTEQLEYWPYENVQQEKFWKHISSETKMTITSQEDFFHKIIQNILWDNIELYNVSDDNLAIEYYKETPDLGFIFHLFRKKQQQLTTEDEFIVHQNDIRKELMLLFTKKMHSVESYKKLKWLGEDEKNYPILMANKIYLTSLPQGWINIESKTIDGVVYFEHALKKHAYGSANRIATKGIKFHAVGIHDVKNIKI